MPHRKSRLQWLALATLLGLAAVWAADRAWFPGAREPGSGPGQFRDPTGIAITETEVFVSDSRNARIQVFDHDGRFRRQFGTPDEGRPMNLSIHNQELYVADYWNDRIQVFSLAGKPLRTIGRSGSAPGEFSSPGGVAVAANGDLFVADFGNNRIQKWRPHDGK